MTMTDVDITGLDKALVLQTLFNASFQPTSGMWDERGHRPMTVKEARTALAVEGLKFDYLFGRLLKVDLSGNTFYAGDYDRDNAWGQAAALVEALRGTIELVRRRRIESQTVTTDQVVVAGISTEYAVEFEDANGDTRVHTETPRRSEAEDRLLRYRDMYSSARVVQRRVYYGPWGEAP